MSDSYDWVKVWNTPTPQKNKKDHIATKKENYETVKSYLETPPKKMLEIGCGIAREAEWFQKEFGTELWLLDGDKQSNDDKQKSYYHWNATQKFAFYSPINSLKESYDSRDMSYRFVDANNIDIPEDETFDLICSFKSCGFHFPISEYSDLIKKHSDENTRLIFDIRKEHDKPKGAECFEIVSIIDEGRKHYLCEIRLS